MIETRNNKVYIGGVEAQEIAEEFGTPLMAYSEEYIRNRCTQLRETWMKAYPGNRAAYAAKAFLTPALCQIIQEEGLSLDVVSGGELYMALKAGFPAERIEFNGNNKSEDELRIAINNGVGRIIIDGIDEAEIIDEICRETGKTVKALIRIIPGVDSHTHRFITTGNVDSKFGIPLQGETFDKCFREIMSYETIELIGFHFHIGSQLHENDSYLMAVDVLFEVIQRLKGDLGYVPEEINVGGGFGIRYTDEDNEKPYSYFLQPIMHRIMERCNELQMPLPAVVIEPGRSVVANSAVSLYRVGAIKEIPGVRKYVSVDGGMTDNIRPALYDSKYECFIEKNNRNMGKKSKSAAGKSTETKEIISLCGKCCESGDVLIRDAVVNRPARGDLAVVYSTGAYCYAMSSNYNGIPKPAVVMVSGGKAREIVRRQSYEDLLSVMK